MTADHLESGAIETSRHRTTYFAAGPEDGPLLVFLHGCPDHSIFWRHQLAYFAARGWRCIAPDMRGFGGSSVPDSIAAYTMREAVHDMVELHDALGGRPAVWVGHDWGCNVAWSMAAHHAARCRGVAALTVPYYARGATLETLLPLVDRDLYPEDEYPAGQWDYWLFYREHFARAVEEFEADVPATFRVFLRAGAPQEEPAKPVITALVRRQGGWFGAARRAPAMPRDETIMSDADFATVVAAYERTGFSASMAWYCNDPDNRAFAAEAPDFGRISVPALFVHGLRDAVCDTTRSRMAEPMREDVADLAEVVVDAGHLILLERPAETNEAIARWLAALAGRGI